MLTMVQTPVSFADDSSADRITGILPLPQTEYLFEGEPSEVELTLNLPQTLSVQLNGTDEVTEIPVSWDIVEDYEQTEYYFYSARPVWSEDYALDSSLDPEMDVPWIILFRQSSEEEIEEGEPELEIPVSDPEELEPVYTEEEGAPEEEAGDEVSLAGLFAFFAEESYAVSASDVARVYSYLTDTMGLNMAAACGVMTNIYAESGMLSNNLENTYNKKYGLSDAEYTKRVNAGKNNNGKYKSGSGATRYFTKDYCGYGLCQWTSLGRRKNLLKLAVKKDVSIADINMQLEFLKGELSGSYQQVWATLRGVPNNAAGAYLAAAHFCYSFEVPANTSRTAISRARTALSTYWKTYSGKSASASGTSFLGLCGYTYPQSIKKGKGMTCSGHVISNYNIKSVTAKILNSKGTAVYSSTKKPNAAIYSLYKFDNSMKFGKLSAGSYTYQITAKDSSGKKVTAKHSFNVAKDGSTKAARGCTVTDISKSSIVQNPEPAVKSLQATGLNYPKKIKKGKPFTIKGTIQSNRELKKVTVMVKTKKGKKKLSASASPSGVKSYNLKKLDDDLTFGKLKRGTYYYIVKASDTKESKQLLKKKFKVK